MEMKEEVVSLSIDLGIKNIAVSYFNDEKKLLDFELIDVHFWSV
jgi:hypothetical protein